MSIPCKKKGGKLNMSKFYWFPKKIQPLGKKSKEGHLSLFALSFCAYVMVQSKIMINLLKMRQSDDNVAQSNPIFFCITWRWLGFLFNGGLGFCSSRYILF